MSKVSTSELGKMNNGFDPSKASNMSAREKSMVERRAKLLGPAYRLMYQHPVEFVSSKGVHMYDAEGNAFLDCYNNVVSVGHCNPAVVQAVTEQVSTLNTHTRYMNEKILNLSEQLLDAFEPEIGHVMYACTGSEANDLAVRVARFVTRGQGIIVTKDAYHGTTASISALSPNMGKNTPLDIYSRVVPAPDPYRAAPGVDVIAKFAQDIENAIADMERHGIKFAGFLADALLSSDGLFPEPIGALKAAYEVTKKHGGLYIADEVQSGFGRSGSHMWGYQRHGFVPDLVVMGKPMGNGIPVAAMAARPEHLVEFGAKARYFNTFGGNPVSIAAAHAVLNEVQGGLRENAQIEGQFLLAEFKKLQKKYAHVIGDVRGAGLFLSVEFVSDIHTKEPFADLASAVTGSLRERRILISTTGPYGNCLKIRPLLCFSRENSVTLVEQLDEAIKESLGALGVDLAPKKNSLTDKATPVSPSFAQSVVESAYGIQVKSIKRLRSERDQNFLVVTADDVSLNFKIHHPSEDPLTSNFITSEMHYVNVHAPEIPIQRVLPTTDGKYEFSVTIDDEPRIARLVTFLDGTLLEDAERSLKQSFNLGAAAGKLASALKGFSHPGQDHVLLWDLKHASTLRRFLPVIEDVSAKAKLEAIITNFEKRVLPLDVQLRKQVVHSDLNGSNVLVDSNDNTIASGILDFGDSCRTWLINDVAVGACYALGGEGDMQPAIEFAKGYNSTYPLLDVERDVLFDLILTRVFVRATVHNWRAREFPENKEYILRNNEDTFKLIDTLTALDPAEVRESFKKL